MKRHPRNKPAGQAGFSLVEILVTLAVFSIVTYGLVVVFDNSSRLARLQTQQANIQQAQRVGHSEIVRFVRMAGVGGLPITRLQITTAELSARNYDIPGRFPNGIALSVVNGVGADTTIREVLDPTLSESDGDEILEGSDVLIVRGVFSTPVYYSSGGYTVTLKDSDTIADGILEIESKIQMTGDVTQDRFQDVDVLADWLKEAYQATDITHRDEALILRDLLNPNAYAVMAFDHANPVVSTVDSLTPKRCTNKNQSSTHDSVGLCLTLPVLLNPKVSTGLAFTELSQGTVLQTNSGNTLLEASTNDPLVELPTRINSIGLLEEYRFFIRVDEVYDEFAPGGKRLAPVLSRARFLPGTSIMVERVDIADNVIDLQIALGVETDSYGDVGYGIITDSGDETDEVLFNSPADLLSGNPPYIDPPTGTIPGGHQAWYSTDLEYHYVRVNTIVQGDQRNRNFQSPPLNTIEDYNRGDFAVVSDGSITYNSFDSRRFRRRWLQTTVELRNLQ